MVTLALNKQDCLSIDLAGWVFISAFLKDAALQTVLNSRHNLYFLNDLAWQVPQLNNNLLDFNNRSGFEIFSHTV